MVTVKPRGIERAAPEALMVSPIAKRLRETIGLKPDAVNARKITAAIGAWRSGSSQLSASAYYRHLEGSSLAWQELVEDLLVAETWFFRHRDTFGFLDRYLREWRRRPAGDRRPLRVLSLPCATGEEPYSLAIRFLEAGLSPSEFRVDAMDLSLRSLRSARCGIYNKNSFREGLTARERGYFQAVGDKFSVSDRLRATVRFQWGNLLEERRKRAYDLVFCRHLLIYLEDRARVKAIDNLHRLLDDGGALVIGASEAGALKSPDWTAIDPRRGYLYRPSSRGGTSRERGEPIAPPTTLEPNSRPDDLEIARELADRGDLATASDRCRQYLQENPICARGYLLLGEIDRALGAIRPAENHFQKALYLDPGCTEALIHLALLRESQGDYQSSIAIRRRLQRAVNSRSSV